MKSKRVAENSLKRDVEGSVAWFLQEADGWMASPFVEDEKAKEDANTENVALVTPDFLLYNPTLPCNLLSSDKVDSEDICTVINGELKIKNAANVIPNKTKTLIDEDVCTNICFLPYILPCMCTTVEAMNVVEITQYELTELERQHEVVDSRCAPNYLYDRFQFTETSLINLLEIEIIHNKPTIDLFFCGQGNEAGLYQNKNSEHIVEELHHFEQFIGTIDDLLEKKPRHGEGLHRLFMYGLTFFLCVYIAFNSIQWKSVFRSNLKKMNKIQTRVNSLKKREEKKRKNQHKQKVQSESEVVIEEERHERQCSAIVCSDFKEISSMPTKLYTSKSESSSITALTSRTSLGVAKCMKTLTSSFTQEGFDEKTALQLARVALDIQHKEISEVRRIKIEEDRRKEDMILDERRHQEKIKAMYQKVRLLNDEAQKACMNVKTTALCICLGTHQILCIFLGCSIRFFRQNWTQITPILKTPWLQLISSWCCNCLGEKCDSGITGHDLSSWSLSLLVTSSLIPSMPICSAMCFLRILFTCTLLAMAQKLLAICKSPFFLHQMLNGAVFIFTMISTQIGRNMTGLAAIITVNNFIIATLSCIVLHVTGCNTSSDEQQLRRKIDLALKISSYSLLLSVSASFLLGLMPIS